MKTIALQNPDTLTIDEKPVPFVVALVSRQVSAGELQTALREYVAQLNAAFAARELDYLREIEASAAELSQIEKSAADKLRAADSLKEAWEQDDAAAFEEAKRQLEKARQPEKDKRVAEIESQLSALAEQSAALIEEKTKLETAAAAALE